MASEENSFQIEVAGITWAFSMVYLIKGIFKFSNSGKVIELNQQVKAKCCKCMQGFCKKLPNP